MKYVIAGRSKLPVPALAYKTSPLPASALTHPRRAACRPINYKTNGWWSALTWCWGLRGHPGTGTQHSAGSGTTQAGPAAAEPQCWRMDPPGKQRVSPARPAGAGDRAAAAQPPPPCAPRAVVPAGSPPAPRNGPPAGSQVTVSSASQRSQRHSVLSIAPSSAS